MMARAMAMRCAPDARLRPAQPADASSHLLLAAAQLTAALADLGVPLVGKRLDERVAVGSLRRLFDLRRSRRQSRRACFCWGVGATSACVALGKP